jgi:ribonuclease D
MSARSKVPSLKSIELHRGDLPADLKLSHEIAIDTETMGLDPNRDRLCLVQISGGDGVCHIVQFAQDSYDAPNLAKILGDSARTKIFHFARFDVAMIQRYLNVLCTPLFCTKIASRLTRTYTDRHGLKDLCKEVLGVDLSKQQQSSDWGASELSQDQLHYAASDVLYLHALKERLTEMLAREGRTELAEACFRFLPARAVLDLAGWAAEDIFAH